MYQFRQAVGSDQMWWDISTGGMLMARIGVARSDRDPWLASPPPLPAPPAINADSGSNTAARAPTAPPVAFGGGGDGARQGLGWRTDALLNRWAAEIEASVAAGALPSYEVSAVAFCAPHATPAAVAK